MAKRYYRRRMSSKRPLPSKRKVVKKALRTAANARIKAVVKRVLGTQAETKVLQTSGSINARPFDNIMSSANFNSCVMCLTPQGGTLGGWSGGGYAILGNGIGQDQRIGDECRMKATYFNYLCIPQSYNATTNPVPAPQIVTLYFIKPKIRNASGLASSNILAGATADFFECQTNTDSGFSGTLIDMLRKVDRDNYQVIAIRQHKLGYAGNLNTSNQLSTFPNNDFKAFAKGRVKIPSYVWKCNRLEEYESRNIYVFATSVRADNTAIPSTQIPVVINFNLANYFTDM